jgi:hypothetical protein
MLRSGRACAHPAAHSDSSRVLVASALCAVPLPINGCQCGLLIAHAPAPHTGSKGRCMVSASTLVGCMAWCLMRRNLTSHDHVEAARCINRHTYTLRTCTVCGACLFSCAGVARHPSSISCGLSYPLCGQHSRCPLVRLVCEFQDATVAFTAADHSCWRPPPEWQAANTHYRAGPTGKVGAPSQTPDRSCGRAAECVPTLAALPHALHTGQQARAACTVPGMAYCICLRIHRQPSQCSPLNTITVVTCVSMLAAAAGAVMGPPYTICP